MDKKYYVIGLGGYGSKMAEELSLKMKKDGSSVFSLAFDTDHYEIEGVNCDYTFDLSASEDFSSIIKKLEKKKIKFFPDTEISELNYAMSTYMDRGASLWRLKAYICFTFFMSIEENKKRLDNLLNEIALNKDEQSEIYFVGSLAGGTSSALALPISLYIKKTFREQGYKNYKTLFFATTPDVFAISMNGELKTKAFANAYATLSEINTVNLISSRRDLKKFKMGGENMPFGVLFDGINGEFNHKACKPFSDVVLFDRMPAVTSVETFRAIVTDYVYHYYLGLVELQKNKDFGDVKIYSGFCVSELNYSLEDNVNYVTKQVTSKKLTDELSKAYALFNKTEKESLFGNSSKRTVTETEKFTNAVIESVTNLYDENLGKVNLLLNRSKDYEYGGNVLEDEWTVKYVEKLRLYFSSIINENEKYKELKEKLNKSFFNKDENNKINFTKKGKKAKNKEFSDYYKTVYNQLKEITNELIDNYYNDQKLNDLIYNNDELSIEKIIIENNNFIHPTLALVKLSQLFNIVCQRQRAYLNLSESEINCSLIYKETPVKIYEIEGYLTCKKGYGRLSGDRLIKTFEENNCENIDNDNKIKNKYLIKNPKKEEKYLISDFNKVIENLENSIYGIFISKISNSIEKLINNYRKFYDRVETLSKKLNEQLGDLVSSGTVASGYYTVRSKLSDRNSDVEKYDLERSKKSFDNIDGEYGKILFQFVKKADEPTIERLNAVLFDLLEAEQSEFAESDLYAELQGKNVLSAMCEPKACEYSKSLLKTACNVKPHFLTENKSEEIQKRVIRISGKVCDYVLENAKTLMLRETTPNLAVEELLSSIGDFETQVVIDDSLPVTKAVVVAERSAVSINSITKVNCEEGNALYKVEYKKAISNKTGYCSEMWNPHVFLLDGKTELCNI